jgi:murein DD-endopeptidase MepM/ murein hydrolase activator NlpD
MLKRNSCVAIAIGACVVVAAGCGVGAAGVPVAATEEGLLVDQQLPDIALTIPVPAGYGTYCSITDAAGNWALGVLGQGQDPCTALQQNNGANGTIQRAGLWSLNHTNNAMVQCDGLLYIFKGEGSAPIDEAFAAVTSSNRNCVFTVAPVALPIFSTPIFATASSYAAGYSVPNFDRGQAAWDPRMFGQGWGDSFQSQYCATLGVPGEADNPVCNSNADCTGWFKSSCQHIVPWDQKHCVTPRCSGVAFDRTGTERGYMSGPNGGETGEPGLGSFEIAYDWNQPDGTPLLAMADGVVAYAGCRDYLNKGPFADLNAAKAGNCQEELFIEHQVGTGRYSEHFIAAYHHMDWNYYIAPTGTVVHRGDVVGYIGTSGNSGGYHLDLSVSRTTNLSGGRNYKFRTEPTLYGACGAGVGCNNNGATTYFCEAPASNPALNCNTTYGCNCVSVYGANGAPGVIDPYGWAAPQGVDPMAWMFLSQPDWTLPQGVTSDGAYSINLMDPNAHPYGASYPIPPTVGPYVN